MPRLLAAALWAVSAAAFPVIESGLYSNCSTPGTNETFSVPYGNPRVPHGTGSVIASPTATATSTLHAGISSKTPIAQPHSAPTANLRPAIHWDQQRHNIENLRPQDAHSGTPLYYDQHGSGGRADPRKEAMMAFVTPYFKSPSVVLDHSDFIQSVTYQQGALNIVFTSQTGYTRASTSWNVDKSLLIVTSTEGCGGYWDGERCYFQVRDVAFNPQTRSAVAKGAAASFNDVIDKVEIEWGTWKPAKTTYGLPTACLGDYFDLDLDDDLGYRGLEAFPFANRVQQAAPDQAEHEVADKNPANFTFLSDAEIDALFPTLDAKRKRQVHSRRFLSSVKTRIKAAANTIKNGARAALDTAKKVGTAVVNGVKGEVEKIKENPLRILKLNPAGALINHLGKTEKDFDQKYDKIFLPRKPNECNPNEMNEKKKHECKPRSSKVKIAKSHWGDQLLLASFGSKPDKAAKGGVKRSSELSGHLNLYCVDCGIQGSVAMKGKVVAAPFDGITDGYLTFDADIKAGLSIGIEAQLRYNFAPEKAELFRYALNPYNIHGIIEVGPVLSLGADFEFEAKADGRLRAGAEYRLAKATYTYNFKDKTSTSAGWNPEFHPIFEAEGEIAISAEVGLPIELALGMHVLGGNCPICKWDVHIENGPSLKATAQIAAKIGLNDDGKLEKGLTSANGCKGISTGISWRNKLTAGYRAGLLNGKRVLHDTDDKEIAQGCIKLGPQSASKQDGEEASHEEPPEERRRLMIRQDNTTVATNETIVDLTEAVVTDLTYIGYQDSNVTANPYNDTNGYDFTRIMDYSGKLALTTCTDGNLYIHATEDEYNEDIDSHCGDLWAHTEKVAVMDGSYDVLHYYNNTMSAVGVSRLRVSNEKQVPSSSVYVALVPFDLDEDPTSPNVYVAVDADYNMFFPVECAYKDTEKPAKVFLVKDPATGIEMLQNKDVVYSITGGEVSECQFLALKQGIDEENLWDKELVVGNEKDWELEYNFDEL